MSERLRLALESGALSLPPGGTIAVFHPPAGSDLAAIPIGQALIVQPHFPAFAEFQRQGFTCKATLDASDGPFTLSLIHLPRAKALARGLIAVAADRTEGFIAVDGQKTDGIDSMLKAVRARTEMAAPFAKAHGKLFTFAAERGAFADWAMCATEIDGGWMTVPGVFSADAVDPASRALGDALPRDLGRRVGDLGAGWGYLGARILERKSVAHLDVVEADARALACAKSNLTDARAHFHWDDARSWQAEVGLDSVVMNPPFHAARAAEPELGRAFIRNAARVLAPAGTLFMVANRHLPYESTLSDAFREVRELDGDGRFKIIQASRRRRAFAL